MDDDLRSITFEMPADSPKEKIEARISAEKQNYAPLARIEWYAARVSKGAEKVTVQITGRVISTA